MVGDSYRWDIEPANNAGVDSVLVDSDYHQENLEKEPAKNVIKDMSEILDFI